jgi:RHS repeat-associated protein
MSLANRPAVIPQCPTGASQDISVFQPSCVHAGERRHQERSGMNAASTRLAPLARLLLAAIVLAITTPAIAQSDDNIVGSGTSGVTDTQSYARQLQQQSAVAEQQLQQGRDVLQALASRHPELAARQAQAESAVQTGRSDASAALDTLNRASAARADREQASARLATLLTPPRRDTQEGEPALPQALALTNIPVQRAARSAPDTIDLAPTLDAPITPEIQAQADALSNQPVAIFEWVRKQIAFVPSAGSLQGAAGTLQTRRGNATDQASLLIALLRASGVHSRYVIGNVEIDATRAKRWLGVDRIEAVTELFTEGGIPFEVVVSGGSVSAIRFSHVWVEAWIDFAPSRGAVQRDGDAWVGLDPSYKDLSFDAGLDLATLMALDAATIRSAISAAAVVDQSGHYLSALGANVLAQQLSGASARLREVLRSRGLLDARVGELLPRATDSTPDYPFFLGNLPYKVLANTLPAASLGEEHRHRLLWTWQIDDNGLPGATLLTLDQPTVALAGSAVQIRYVPAAAIDRDVLLALIPGTLSSFDDLPEALPAYLIQLKAELWLGNTRLAQSSPLGLGKTVHARLSLRRPDGIESTQTETAFAGESRALSLSWHGGLAASLAQSVEHLRDAQSQLAAGGNASATAIADALLQVAGRGHLAISDAYQAWLAGTCKVAFYRAFGVNSAYAALEVAAPFGVITTAYPAGMALNDVSPPHLGAPLANGGEARFVHQSLYAQSNFGHLLLQQLYGGEGRSAARVFRYALDINQRVYRYLPQQLGDLAALALPAAVNAPISAALTRGDNSTFVASPQTLGSWSGYGTQIDYPAALGGSSFVLGQVRPETGSQRQGASVSNTLARGLMLTGWLGDDAPPVLLNQWQGELDRAIGAGDGLNAVASGPMNLGLSDLLINILSGAVLDHVAGSGLDPLIDEHLFGGLIDPILSITPLIDPIRPVVSLSVNPLTIDLGQSTLISASATDNKGVVSLLVTAAGEAITLSNGQSSYTPTRAGLIPIIARARDEAGNIDEKREDLLVRAPGDVGAPVVSLITPVDDAEVSKPTDIVGTVTDDSLVSWKLTMRPGNSPTATPVILGQGDQPITAGVLGKLDPTMMWNGVYILILEAHDANGLSSDTSIQVRVDGDMKIGHFRISFEDIEIPLQGIPIRITRTYDTRQSGEKLDFGYGWSIDYQNVRIRESRKLGFSWRLEQNGGGFAPFCVKPAGSPIVTINLPDGKTEKFKAKWGPECQQWLPPIYGNLVFEPADGDTHSTLEQLSFGQLRAANIAGGASNIIDLDNPGEPVDPRLYKLTTEDGMVYFLDQNFGVQRIRDQAGNTVDYTRNGIIHSSGVSVQFIRDSQDRITDIVLPDGRRLKYRYTAAGDLLDAADPIGQKTSFAYLANVRYPHYLETIADGRGVQAVRQEYDDDGRLVATTDADGNRIEYVHNIAGNTEIIKNRRGFSTTYVYDDNGYVLSETNALGEQTLHTYDPNGVELTRTDPLNRVTEWTVDARGNALTEKDPLGKITTRTWGYYNQLLTEVDPLGRPVSTNDYHTNPLTGVKDSYLTETTDALGNTTRFFYDLCGDTTCGNTGNIRSMFDAAGSPMGFIYDRVGNVIEESDANNQRTTRAYDAMNRLTRETRTRNVNGVVENLVTSYTYDAKGRLTRTQYPDGSASTTTYNAIDKVELETDALGRSTRYTYNNRGEQIGVQHADGSSESTEYDEEGNVIAQTDRAGRTTRMVYDAANRLIETIEPDDTPNDDSDNPRSRSIYDAAGQLIASVDALGHRTEYSYDAAGRQIEVKDALNQTMSTEYDAAGQRVAVTDALGRTTRFVYDAAGRMVETIHPDETPDNADNPRTRYGYDALGRKVAETDEMGRITRYTYDKLSRLTSVILPNPANGSNPELVDGQSPANSGTLVTRYDYDEQGNKTAQTDAEGRTTRWAYDKQGRQLSRTLPMGQVESFVYDANGQRVQHTTFNSEIIGAQYDNLGRPSQLSFPNNKLRSFQYTLSGQIAEINDGGLVYRFTYDSRDRLLSATDPFGRTLNYGYDLIGNRTELSSARQQVQYQYDVLNRLREVVATLGANPPQTSSYSYDAVGNRAGMVHPNGTVVEYQYDVRNRLKTLIHKASQTAGAAILLSLSYSVDASGLRTQISETRPGTGTTAITRVTSYTYDAVKRLTRETVSGSSAQARTSNWTYDKVGNRKTESSSGTLPRSQTYTYDANDRLLSETGTQPYTYTYDAAGNILQKKQGTTVVADYTWDAEGRMTQAVTGSGASQKTIAYSYDANGIRRSQQLSDAAGISRTDYLVDPNQAYAQVLEEWDASAASGNPLGNATLSNVYVYGDDLISQTLLAGDQISATSIYHYDGLGTTRALSAYNVDANGTPTTGHGAITDRYAYTAFGESDPAGTSGNTSGATDNNYRYTGEQLDPNLGFYYLRARYMDPRVGRFLGMDAWGGSDVDAVTLHKYLYANANPVMGIDPSGNLTLTDLNIAQDAQAVLSSISQVGFRQFVKQAVTGTMRVARLALNEAKNCFRNPRNCKLKIPILIVGNETPETSQHILDAQTNKGSSLIISPFWLTRKSPPHSRAWLRNNTDCATKVRGVTSCDEYPFASTEEGGVKNRARVSLRPVPVGEQSRQGGLLSAFYFACRISKTRTSGNPINDKRTFLVLATPSIVGFPLCLR